MIEDEQEALSARYVLPRVMRLSSGRFALFTGRHLDQLQIFDTAGSLIEAIPTYEELPEVIQPTAQERSQKLQSLNLADLGL